MYEPANGTPEDLGWSTEVNRSVRRFSVHTLAEEPHVLHLLTNKSAGETNLLAPDYHNLLAIEQLFRHNRRQATKHVVASIHDHALRAYS